MSKPLPTGKARSSSAIQRQKQANGGRRNRRRTRRPFTERLENRLLLALDFGDAPAPYFTTLANDGARHEASGPMLGATRVSEPDAQPSDGASGDEDDDGVVFGPLRVGQLGATVDVQVSGAPSGARLDAWIDFNGDGSWTGDREQIADNMFVATGGNVLRFDVPPGAVSGRTIARFRLSTNGDLGVRGYAADGEVEDYALTIEPPFAANTTFARHAVNELAISNPYSVFAADMDNDGDQDLVSGSYEEGTILWFERFDVETFHRHEIATGLAGALASEIVDLDQDGDLDVLASGWEGHRYAWLENDGLQHFEKHIIGEPARNPWMLAARDIDRDGDLDLLTSSFGDNNVSWYENDGDANFTTYHSVDLAAPGASVVDAADMDGDGDVDIVAGLVGARSFVLYRNDGAENFSSPETISFGDPQDILLVDFDHDGDQDIMAPSYDSDLSWLENDGMGFFTPHLVDSGDAGWRGSAVVDLDGDADLDLLVSAVKWDSVFWHENTADDPQLAPVFSARHLVASVDGPTFLAALDFDADGDVDVISSSQFDDMIAWHINDGGEDFALHSVTNSISGAAEIVAADLDQDGDMDFVSAGYKGDRVDWHENDGNQHFTQHRIVSNLDGAFTVKVVDLDGDGNLDVLSGAFDANRIDWYRNDGDQHFIAENITFNAQAVLDIHATDLDADGDIDLLASLVDSAVWFENDGGENFALRVIGFASGVSFCMAADMDRDGDLDVVAASRFDNQIAWHRNRGDQTFEAFPVTFGAAFALAAIAADLDADGDMDILSAARDNRTIAWHDNDGGQVFAEHLISQTARGARTVTTADLDADGDLDVITNSSVDRKIAWYENIGQQQFVEHFVTATANGAEGVVVADVDGDGDLDIASTNGDVDNTIAWYENLNTLVVEVVSINAGMVDPVDLPRGTQPTSWDRQRSGLRSLEIHFSDAVVAGVDDLVLTHLGLDANTDPETVIELTADQISVNDRVLTIEFVANELPEGAYRLEVLGSVTDLAGDALDGNADGISGDAYQLVGDTANRLAKLNGDWNGDGGVSIFDFASLSYWFGTAVGVAPEYMDLNQDGGITIFDFPVFAQNFGENVVFPAALRAARERPVSAEVDQLSLREKRQRPISSQQRLDEFAVNDAALLEVLAQWRRRHVRFAADTADNGTSKRIEHDAKNLLPGALDQPRGVSPRLPGINSV